MRLIDADELLNGNRTDYPDVPFDVLGEMVEWFTKIVDEQPTIAASPWHRAEEPPKEYGTYVVCWKDGEKFWWEKADWDEDWCTEEPSWYSFRDGRATIIEPDYWMPIEPPKEDA